VDILSDALAVARTGKPHSARMELRSPWRVHVEALAGAGFHVVLHGSCWMIPPGGGTPLALEAGDLVFFPHGIGHDMTDDPDSPASLAARTSLADLAADGANDDPVGSAGGGCRSTVLLCGAYLMARTRPHPLLTGLPDVVHLPTGLGRHDGLRAAIELLGGELGRPGLGAAAVRPALLDMLLAFIVRAWYEERDAAGGGGAADGWARAVTDPPVRAALDAIHRDPGRGWTVESLGAAAGMSRGAFSRRFAALTGRPPLTYLTWWRMTLAAQRLRESDASLGAIAGRLGYTSEFAFAKAFKRAHGVAPGAYRRDRAG
jgi:AraC-like DNA-binding protein